MIKDLNFEDMFNIRLALHYSIKQWDEMINQAKAEGNNERAAEYLRISAGERAALAKLEGR